MTMKRYINLLLAFCVSALTLQSCFQDMDHPAFDYPDSSAPKVFSPMKLFLPFENDMRLLNVAGQERLHRLLNCTIQDN